MKRRRAVSPAAKGREAEAQEARGNTTTLTRAARGMARRNG
ncbi:hypothetical protein J2794_001758 [Paraburkholderia terricola]|nr:hypothetical protein [Paraburkholderia terricola]